MARLMPLRGIVFAVAFFKGDARGQRSVQRLPIAFSSPRSICARTLLVAPRTPITGRALLGVCVLDSSESRTALPARAATAPRPAPRRRGSIRRPRRPPQKIKGCGAPPNERDRALRGGRFFFSKIKSCRENTHTPRTQRYHQHQHTHPYKKDAPRGEKARPTHHQKRHPNQHDTGEATHATQPSR